MPSLPEATSDRPARLRFHRRTCFGVPEFLPQIRKLSATCDITGISWSWVTLTCVNNAAWISYFTLARYWTALIPSSSATLLAGTLAVMLTRRVQTRAQPAAVIGAWAAMLAGGYGIAGAPAWGRCSPPRSSSRSRRQSGPPAGRRVTGISAGTWLLIVGELACWLSFGLHQPDPRLITLGACRITVSALMLARVWWTGRRQPQLMSRDLTVAR